MVAIAPGEATGTVLSMTTNHGLSTKNQHDVRMRHIGRLMNTDTADAHGLAPTSTLALLRTHKALPESPSLHIAPAIRTVDADGRIKLSRGGLLSSSLEWRPGCLEVFCDGPWLVLSQPGELVGATRARNSQRAAFSCDAKGVERVGLSPAHLARVATLAGREVLLIPAPETGALIIASPLVALASLPPAVARVLDRETGPANTKDHVRIVNRTKGEK
jgi:hypothetical protein